MKPELETELRSRIAAGERPRDAIATMLEQGRIANPKQAWRTLEKWAGRGEYDYGVVIDQGWLVDKP